MNGLFDSLNIYLDINDIHFLDNKICLNEWLYRIDSVSRTTIFDGHYSYPNLNNIMINNVQTTHDDNKYDYQHIYNNFNNLASIASYHSFLPKLCMYQLSNGNTFYSSVRQYPDLD